LTSGISRTAGRSSRTQACASGRRAPFLLSRRRRGFTLVEVIVVLVILAILAAIAIPALTGYIDKAKLKAIESQVHTQKIAFQTMIIEAMANGKLSFNGTTVTDNTGWFNNSAYYEGRKSYFIQSIQPTGKEEYAALTGDTQSFASSDRRIRIFCDASGAILYYGYYDFNYFDPGMLFVCDISSPDFLNYESQLPNKKVGINIYKATGGNPALLESWTYEKLN
jgi:prepilin-type N-terminal cleavage/methylation domain-containing protein